MRPRWSFSRQRARAYSTVVPATLSVAGTRWREKSCAIFAPIGEICGLNPWKINYTGVLRLFTTVFSFCLFMLPGSLRSESLAALPTFEVEYSLYARNAKAAQVIRRLSRLEDNSYEYRSETKTVGLISLFKKLRIIETSHLTVQGGLLKPVYYSYKRSGDRKKRDVSIEFNWETNKIKNTINGDFWHMPIQPAVMDKLLYQLAIMYDLHNGQTPVSYLIADGGGIKTYSFEKLGEETIDTPLGSFSTTKMLRHKPGSSRRSVFWCAPALEYLPIKVEHTEKDGSKTVAVIKSLRGELQQR